MSKIKKYITFGAPKIEKEEIKEVIDSLKSRWIGTGPKVAKFEEIIKNYTGSKYAISLNSCTAALHLSLLACGIERGDEVITSPLTFAATANTIIHVGAKPVFVDIKKETMNIDEDLIEKAITDKTKAIIPVHMAGRPCEMDKIMKVAKKHNLYVIEDAAQAIGAEYKSKKIGSIGDLTCFSFYVTKNITTGEGGMITTTRKDWTEKIRIYRLHGMSKDAWKRYGDSGYKHYDFIYPGYKYNLTDIAAAIGIHQMAKIDSFDERRREIWEYYNENLEDLPIILPPKWPEYIKHARHLYTVLIDKKRAGVSRDEFMQKMHEAGIGTGVHFNPVHLHSYYRNNFHYKKSNFPNAEFIGERTVSIPLSPVLTGLEVKKITETIRKIIIKRRYI
ncbi:MAG: DegT/DnrJ/EryC1/StrS family aminotransferase [Patescibacteria group bacterium]|nr:DegT/DnrJ/EryC1/StrS family aminotransferase [Patescibacteria group bacterium]MDE2218330.1 DegT/DnrJ/EryC1/StrS family aminotransferase [Patescibacteria group bacterium]